MTAKKPMSKEQRARLFGEWLRDQRQRCTSVTRMTKGVICEAVGTSVSNFSYWERGGRTKDNGDWSPVLPEEEHYLTRIAQMFEVPVEEVFERAGVPMPDEPGVLMERWQLINLSEKEQARRQAKRAAEAAEAETTVTPIRPVKPTAVDEVDVSWLLSPESMANLMQALWGVVGQLERVADRIGQQSEPPGRR